MYVNICSAKIINGEKLNGMFIGVSDINFVFYRPILCKFLSLNGKFLNSAYKITVYTYFLIVNSSGL